MNILHITSIFLFCLTITIWLNTKDIVLTFIFSLMGFTTLTIAEIIRHEKIEKHRDLPKCRMCGGVEYPAISFESDMLCRTCLDKVLEMQGLKTKDKQDE